MLGITNTNLEKEKAELIKKIYDLGFEVGFKSHSEIGWVIREYNTLSERALKLGIKSPEIHYQDGKLNGKKSRDKGSDTPATEKAAGLVKKVKVSEIKIDHEEIEEFGILHSQKKPELNDFPGFIKQAGITEMPGLIDCFKPNGSSRLRHRKKDKK